MAFAPPATSAGGGPCGPPVVNPVACENTLPGDPASDWQISGTGDQSIQGYATSMSVNVGQTESFKINTPSTAYHIDILRLGYYGGDGARKIASNVPLSTALPQNQPACQTDPNTGLIDCGNWSVSASWTVPSNAVSGVYIAHLVRDDNQDPGGDSQIPFVVRNDASHSTILLSTSDATWEAYNDYGGNSLYTCTVDCPPGHPGGYKGAYAVSYNRPFDGASIDGGASYLFYAEYQMIRFLEENGYDISYTSSGDVDRAGSLLLNHKLFMSSGHDEYWSAGQRANVTAARDAGVNLAFFSGNEVFWKTRWAASEDGSNTPYRTLVSYKETHFDAPTDPQDPPTWTGTWRDPRFSPPADGGNPENALTGQYFAVNKGTADITVPYQYHNLRLWRNTAVASLSPGQSLTLDPGAGTLGYEWDIDADNGFRPPGLFDLSSSTVSGTQDFSDYGTNTVIGTETHHLTLYRAPSGALVFGAGTVQWAWGLDTTNAWHSSSTNPSGNPPDPTMQQATINLFGDMGIQPATLMSGLVAASGSVDTTPPTSTIASPASNSTLQDGNTVTISGSATDAGGGVVAGVEVSTDGGQTWHPATITSSDAQTDTWTYSWIAHGNPTATLETRATDDSGNLERPSDRTPVNVQCPCDLWGNQTPSVPDAGDTNSGELGVKFTSDVYGTVTGLRFYKSAANTGTHVGSLWTTSGQLLARAIFSSETATGWQTVTFSSPVSIQPSTTYIASYFAPVGHYAAASGYFYPPPSPPPDGGGDIDAPPLHGVANASSPNGVYTYGTSPTFPAKSFAATNYWVDPVFVPTPPPGQVTGVTATAGFNSAQVNWNAPTSGGDVTSYTVTPYIGSIAQAPTTVTGSPPVTHASVTGLQQGTAYTFRVQASNPNGSGPNSDPSPPATPTGPSAPAAPTDVTTLPATGQAQVSWTAPNSNGSAITSYTVTALQGGVPQTSIQVGNGSATSATVTGLTNDSSYTFTVSATNSLGTSAQSAATASITPENTIFDFGTPTVTDSGDTLSSNVGVKFTADTSGQILGIRFYKASTNTGTHVGNLWTSGGQLLASATFTAETGSGWQTVLFSSPVAVSAGATYVASYLAPNGHYSYTGNGLATATNNGPLHSVANSVSADGVYSYSMSNAFPTSSTRANNYWVDVLFRATPPGQVTNLTASAGHLSANVSWSAPGGGGATTYTVTPYIGSTAQTPITVTGAPPATSATVTGLQQGTAYTFTVQASNGQGAGPVSAQSNAVTPTAAIAPDAPSNVTAAPGSGQAQVSWTAPSSNGSAISSYTVTPFSGGTALTSVQVNNGSAASAVVKGLTLGATYTFTVTATNGIGTSSASAQTNAVVPEDTVFDFATPAVADSGDPTSGSVGVKFTADTSGQILGVRFYKASTNTGTHVGSLWSSSGQLLASATFTNETGSGWQSVLFSNPVSISAGTTYVASYFAPAGHYSATSGGLNSATDNAPLHSVANGTSANGVYNYASSSSFPTTSYKGSNYWVDVLFAPSPPGAPTNVTATAGIQSANVSWTAPGSGGATSYIVTPFIGSAPQTPTTVSGSPVPTSSAITGLQAGIGYTFKVQAANGQGTSGMSDASNQVTPTAPTAPDAPTNSSAIPASGRALVSWTPPASNGSAIASYTVTPFVGGTAQTPVQVSNGSATSTTVSGLTNGTGYTFQVSATNGVGTGPASGASAAATPEDTIFDFGTPAVVDGGDPKSGNFGVKFTADVNGQVTGVRFFKSPTNTGPHVASLWSSSGQLLASAQFTNESASGWQTVVFSSPVPITAGTTYVASYFAPAGHYSVTAAAFSSVVDNAPLHAVANGISPNGVFIYGAASAFPTTSGKGANYWADVLFQPTP